MLEASKSLFLLGRLLGFLTVSRAIQLTGWPEDHILSYGEHYDMIVVGAGSAGAIVAARLAELSWLRVLLIEAGGDPPATSVAPRLFTNFAGTKYDWNYTAQLLDKSIKRTNNEMNLLRGKVLGGCSSINFMFYTRGVQADYDIWGAVAPGWHFNEVLYYHKKLEGMRDFSVFTPVNACYHSTQGPVLVSRPCDNPIVAEANEAMLQSYREIGIPTVLENIDPRVYGASRPHFTFANGRRSSTAEVYLRQYRPNLYVAKNSIVTKLLICQDTNRAEGVEVLLSNGKTIKVYAELEVIVSAGAIATPKLLMLSGIGPKEELNRVDIPTILDLPTGKNLQDHMFVPMLFAGKEGFTPTLSNIVLPAKPPIPFQSSYIKLNSPLFDSCNDRPSFQTFNIYVAAGASHLAKDICNVFGLDERACSVVLEANRRREVQMTIIIFLHPESRGRVTLKTNSSSDDPRITFNFFSNLQDKEALREGVKFMRRLENTTYFQQNGGYLMKLDIPECNKIPYGSNIYWECYIRNTVGSFLHPVGTCEMGPKRVVDERLRVYGITGLRIADASIIPTIPSGNTNAAIMMIGEKAADLIKEDHGFIEFLQR